MGEPEHIECPGHIDIIREDWVVYAFRDASACCLMTDMSNSFFLDDGINSIDIPDILLIESEILICLMLGNVLVMTSLKAVESDYLIIESEKFFDNIAPDKSCASCDEYHHMEKKKYRAIV